MQRHWSLSEGCWGDVLSAALPLKGSKGPPPKAGSEETEIVSGGEQDVVCSTHSGPKPCISATAEEKYSESPRGLPLLP